MIKFILLVLTLSSTFFLHAQTEFQTRHSDSLRVITPSNWVKETTVPENVESTDLRYIQSVPLNYPNRPGAILFFKFGFDIPVNATIERIDVSLVRKKKGKNIVKDFAMRLGKSCGEGCWTSLEPNKCLREYWTETDKEVVYSFPSTAYRYNGEPDPWTPQILNSSLFGLNLQTDIGTGGKGAAVYLQQLSITVYYTQQPAPRTSIVNDVAALDPGFELKKYGTSIRVSLPREGKYKLTVRDNVGRLLQQQFLSKGTGQVVQLSSRCKGYCIVTIEGNGVRRSQQVFIE